MNRREPERDRRQGRSPRERAIHVRRWRAGEAVRPRGSRWRGALLMPRYVECATLRGWRPQVDRKDPLILCRLIRRKPPEAREKRSGARARFLKGERPKREGRHGQSAGVAEKSVSP